MRRAEGRELERAIGELARVLVSAADEYMRIVRDLVGDERDFAEARRRAASLSLVLGSLAASLAVLAPLIGELPEDLRPPLGAVLALAAIQGSCAQIAQAQAPQKLDGAILAGAAEVGLISDGGPVEAWVRRALAVRVA